ncbi:MAG: FxLYD domain-containing protein [Aeromicrobium sp.]|uniref:FxLYD domain-containing protein n=1 Tax=Aeromicrobium sp. TaxID=1871063 RepID=UPI0039E2AFFD
MTPRAALVGSLLAAALVLTAGCGGGDDSPSKTQVNPENVSPQDLPDVPDLPGAEGAIADATFGECGTDAGSQTVEGEVENSTKAAANYVVAISWINERSDVLARGVTEIQDVKAGKTEGFEVTAEVPEGVGSCTYYVLRAAA